MHGHPRGHARNLAAISPSLASAHLSKLLDGGLLTVEQRGRQRHSRLTSRHVAEVIEAMLTLAPHRQAATLRESTRGQAIRHARTCYDHLAGTLGVTLTDALEHQRVIEATDNSYRVTSSGAKRLGALGLDLAALQARRRTFARPCGLATQRGVAWTL
jgi:hypothetical protein